MPIVSTAEVQSLIENVLAPAGRDTAEIVSRALVDAQARGHHRFGLRLLEPLAESTTQLSAQLRPVHPTSTASVDLAGRFALTAVASLAQAARATAARTGVSLVRFRDIGPFGRLAPFVGAVAQRGAIGVLTMSSQSFVAPHGGRAPVLGTNPFAVAVPTSGDPLVIDSATSAITAAHWHNAKEGKAVIPEGALLDELGLPTVDPHAAAAIASRGGVLGSVLGIAIEALVGAATGQLSDPDGAPRGGVLLVIEPADNANEIGDQLVARLRTAGGRVPGKPIALPETIEVDPNHWAKLQRLTDLASAVLNEQPKEEKR